MELDEIKIHAWIVRLSVAVGIIVGILSWRNGVTLGWLIFRAALSIALIYLLCSGSVALFLKTVRILRMIRILRMLLPSYIRIHREREASLI